MSSSNSTNSLYNSDGSRKKWVVEKILEKKVAEVYLIKWEDFTEQHNTWQVLESLDCPDLLEEFERELSAKEKLSEKTGSYHDRDNGGKGRRNLSKPSTSTEVVPKKANKKTVSSDSSDLEYNPQKESPKQMAAHKKGKGKGRNKKVSHSDTKKKSNSESEKLVESDVQKTIASKSGPKRVKKKLESRLQKLKESKIQIGSKPKDSDNSDPEQNNKETDEDEESKKIMSKPGPKRAKEAGLPNQENPEEKTIENLLTNNKQSKSDLIRFSPDNASATTPIVHKKNVNSDNEESNVWSDVETQQKPKEKHKDNEKHLKPKTIAKPEHKPTQTTPMPKQLKDRRAKNSKKT